MKSNIIKKISISLMSIILIFTLTLITITKEKQNYASNIAYSAQQSQIVGTGSLSANEDDYSTFKQISISNFFDVNSRDLFEKIKNNLTYVNNILYVSGNPIYNNNTNAKEVISIKDGKELYAFSMLCNSNSSFLLFKYVLTSNIDYNDVIRIGGSAFLPVGWKAGHSFEGIFNGQGYEISNLKLIILSDIHNKVSYESNEEDYSQLNFISMFAKNSGTISNFGLIDSNIVQTSQGRYIIGVAPLVGMNETNGVIKNTYVVDMRNAANGKAGITAAGEYNISGFVFANKGKIFNSYVEYSIIVNFSVRDYISFREICTVNYAEEGSIIENVFFLDHSIKEIKDGNYIYDEGLIGAKISVSNMYGTYVKDMKQLNAEIDNLPGWYTNADKDISFGNKRPILQGLREYELDSSGRSFQITSATDFSYIFKIAKTNPLFASKDITYVLMNDIDISNLPAKDYLYNDFFSANIIGVTNYTQSKLIFANNKIINTPTIYGVSIQNSLYYDGYECFGLFPKFDGIFKNINIYLNKEVNQYPENKDSDIYYSKSIGIVAGYLMDGEINNVNVFGNITLNSQTTGASKFGRYYAGGLVGIQGKDSKISNITTSGSINGSTHLSTNYSTARTNYINGNSIGGVVGYAINKSEVLTTVLSAMNITATSYSSTFSNNQYIGGILGSGYTKDFNEAQNIGDITIPSTNAGTVYAAGVIGRQVGTYNAIHSLHNQGDISYSYTGVPTAYISGTINCDIQTVASGSLIASPKNKYNVSAISNSGNLTFNYTGVVSSNVNINTAGVIYLNAKNNFTSTIDGVYNLAYKYNASGAPQSNLSKMEIDISSIKEFAPCIVSSATSISGLTTAKTVYNLRDISFITNNALPFNTVKYSGAILGKYFNLLDIRNEGNLNFPILKNSLTGTNNKFYISGVFEEVSAGCSAKSIFNGGNIDFNIGDSANQGLNVYYNLYISGICYANRNTFTSEAQYEGYNPLSNKYDNKNIGSLDSAINHGNITSSSYRMNDTSLGNSDVGVLKGSVRIAGICDVNESIISSAFNLGSITNKAYLSTSATPYSLESAGIAWLNLGRYAQIRDTANNGKIVTINMSKNSSFVNTAGIVVRNDIYEDGADYGTTAKQHHRQLVCFTVNYGDLYNYNYTPNIETVSATPHSISAGILATGLCGQLNTVNYGNIYGSELISGIFGFVQFYKYATEVTNTNNVTIANSVNYGNVYSLLWYKELTGSSRDVYYSEVIDSLTNQNSEIIELPTTLDKVYGGSVISIISYSGTQNGTTAHTNAKNISVRYLISFNPNVKTICIENATPTDITVTNDTIFTTKQNDSFMGNKIIYAPLSGIEDNAGNIGVFSPKFKFREAIDGKIESVTLTDKYLSDYFQFIAFAKINTQLLDSIGWRAIAYANAAESFSKDLLSIGNLMQKYKTFNEVEFNNLVTESLNTENWVNKCDVTLLGDLLEVILETQNTSQLKNIVKYLFFGSTHKNAITDTLRKTVVSELLAEQNASKEQLINILDSLMYSDLLANIITENDFEYKKIKESIEENIVSLSYSELADLTNIYLNKLTSNSTDFNNIFTDKRYAEAKKDLLVELLSGLSDSVYEEIYGIVSQIAINNSENIPYDISVQLEQALNSLTQDERNNAFASFISLNSFAGSQIGIEDVIKQVLKKFDIESLVVWSDDNTVNEKVLDDFNTKLNSTNLGEFNMSATNVAVGPITNNTSDYDVDGTNDTSDKLTSLGKTVNGIDYSSIWNLVKNNPKITEYLNKILTTVTDVNEVGHKGIYALATEYRNSYQTQSPKAGTRGRFRNNGYTNAGTAPTADTQLISRFIYTPDDIVNNDTYYYGPFVNANNQIFSYLTQDILGAQNMKLNVNTETATTKRYAPLFISLDPKFLSQEITNYNYSGAKNTNLYTFIWNNNDTGNSAASIQWVSTEIITTKPADSRSVLLKNYNDSKFGTNGTYKTLDGNPYYYNFDNDSKLTTTQERAITPSIVNNNGTSLSTAASVNYLTAYCSAAMITGIYFAQDQWEQNGAYLTMKDYKGVSTTHFIDYSIEDLIRLDGVKTKGRSNGSVDEAEKGIINILMQEILSTYSGKSVIMSAISDVIMKNDLNANTLAISKLLLESLASDLSNGFTNKFLNEMIYIENSYNLKVINQPTNNTFQSYLSSKINTGNLSTYEKLIAIKDQKYYSAIVSYLLSGSLNETWMENNEEYLDWISNYPDPDIDFMYKFILRMKEENGLNDSQIVEMLTSASRESILLYYENFLSAATISAVTNTSGISSDFTFNNFTGSTDAQSYDNVNYYENVTSSIDKKVNSTIVFRTPNVTGNTYSIKMIAKNNDSDNKSITLNSQVFDITSVMNEYLWTGLAVNTQYTMQVPANISIYQIDTYSVATTQSADTITEEGFGWERTASGNFYLITSLSNNSTFTITTSGGTSRAITLYATTTGSSKTINVSNGTNLSVTTSTTTVSTANLSAGTYTFTVPTGISIIYIYYNHSNTRNYAYIGSNYSATVTSNNPTNNGFYSNLCGVTAAPNTIILNQGIVDRAVNGHYIVNNQSKLTLSGNSGVVKVSGNGISSSVNVTDNGETKTITATSRTSQTVLTFIDYNIVQQILTFSGFANITLNVNNATLVKSFSVTGKISSKIAQQNANILNGTNTIFTTTNEMEKFILNDIASRKIRYFNPGVYTNVGTKLTENNEFTVIQANPIFNVNSVSKTDIAGLSFYNKFNLDMGSINNNFISFNISSSSLIYVYAKTNETTNKTITLSVGAARYSQTLTTANSVYIFKANAHDLSSARLYSEDGSIGIYKIVVVEEKTPNLGKYSTINEVKNLHLIFDNYDNFIDVFTVYRQQYSDIKAFVNLFYAGFNNNKTTTSIPLWNKLDESQIKDLIGIISAKDDIALNKFIDNATSKSVLMEVIAAMSVVESGFISEVISQANITNLTDKQKLMFAAAYIGTDFSDALYNENLSNTKMKQILDDLSNAGQLKDITGNEITSFLTNSNSEFDKDMFILLMEVLEFNLSTDGYGIYALSSSNGILNGEFIPDNINLALLDTYYTYDKTRDIFVLYDSNSGNETKDSSWRRGENSLYEDNHNDISDINSVNYAFYKEMKQLKKSIASNIFDLTLISTDGENTIFVGENSIDNKNKIVSFYLPDNADGLNKTYVVNMNDNKYKISYNASFYVEEVGEIPNKTVYQNTFIDASKFSTGQIGEMKIYVYAEDRTVRSEYTIKLFRTKASTIELVSAQYNGNVNVSYNSVVVNGNRYIYTPVNNVNMVNPVNGTIKLELKTNNIAASTNLMPNILIDGLGVDSKMYSFIEKPIVTQDIISVDGSGNVGYGSVLVNINISSDLPKGLHTISIKLSSQAVYEIQFYKSEATGNSIESFVFDGLDISFTLNAQSSVKEATTYIKFGRAFTFEELTTVDNNKLEYVDQMNISSLATISATAEIYHNDVKVTMDSNKLFNNGILIYKVTIIITSESGVSNTYIHYLIEEDPFKTAKNNGQYINSNYDSNNYVTTYLNGEMISAVPNIEGEIKTSFEREDEFQNEKTPKYRFNYNFEGFYQENDEISSKIKLVSEQKSFENEQIYFNSEARYYGFYVNYFMDAKPNDYVFYIMYEINDISWNGVTYKREYACPTITITKEFSRDSYLKNIIFIEEAAAISSQVTFGSTQKIYADEELSNSYQKFRDNSDDIVNDVIIDTQQISYLNPTDSPMEYYIVGAVNNASLSNYSPIFEIKSYSQIYQFKDLDISLEGQPENIQRFLYVMFVDENNVNYVFFVHESWKYIYIQETQEMITLNKDIELSYSFIKDTISYAISEYAGTTSSYNISLEMDFIGMPDDGELWYVNYIVYSEAYRYNEPIKNQYYKIYHIAVIDLRNTIRFTFNILNDPNKPMDLESVYLTIDRYKMAENDKSFTNATRIKAISGFATITEDKKGYVMVDTVHNSKSYGFQALEFGYYMFYLDLPSGYYCTYEVSDLKKNTDNQWSENNSYLPPSSLVTQNIDVTIKIISSDDIEEVNANFAWGQKILSVLSREAQR